MEENILDKPNPQEDPLKKVSTIRRNFFLLSITVLIGIGVAFYYLLRPEPEFTCGTEVLNNNNDPVFQNDSLHAVFREGQSIFLEFCASCHNNNMTTDLTGPALRGLTQRRTQNWLYNYIRNSAKMVMDKDSTALLLSEQWDNATMTPFPDLNNEDIDKILFYIENN